MKRTSLAGLAFAALLAATPSVARMRGGGVRSAPGRAVFAAYTARSFVARTAGGGRGYYGGNAAGPGWGSGWNGAYAYQGSALHSFGSFHPMGRAFFSRGLMGAAPTGPSAPAPAPKQGFAVPGALIRTAGSAPPVYSQPDQPVRTFEVQAGVPQLNPALADNSANYRQGVFQGERTLNPPPNPGFGSGYGMNPSGYTGITPNGPLNYPGSTGSGGGGDYGNGNGGQNNGNGNGGNNGNGQGDGGGNGNGNGGGR